MRFFAPFILILFKLSHDTFVLTFDIAQQLTPTIFNAAAIPLTAIGNAFVFGSTTDRNLSKWLDVSKRLYCSKRFFNSVAFQSIFNIRNRTFFLNEVRKYFVPILKIKLRFYRFKQMSNEFANHIQFQIDGANSTYIKLYIAWGKYVLLIKIKMCTFCFVAWKIR